MRIYFLFLFLFSMSMYGQGVTLNKNTMSIGGRAAFPMSFNRADEFRLSVDLAPRFGIFLINNLELSTEFFTQINYISNNLERKVTTPVKWGLSSEVLYYFDTPTRITPYVGGGLGFMIMNWNLLTINLSWSLPLGMLIALQKNMAIDLGVWVKGFMSFRSLGERIEFSPGFIGFRYFF